MIENPNSAICLLSGGLDSLGALCLYLEKCRETGKNDYPVETLTIDYGQKAAKQEIASAKAISDHFGLIHQVIELPWLGSLGGSSLTDSSKNIESPDKENLDDLEDGLRRARSLWVPNRNGVFLNLAAAIAEARGFRGVILGFNLEEAETFPDNSAQFMNVANDFLSYSTLTKVRVFSPTVSLSKPEIMKELFRLDGPVSQIWSCYNSGEKMCAHCESCKRLIRASEGVSECNLRF